MVCIVTSYPQQGIIEFFTKNMVNDSLGTICNAHVVHADMSDIGALDKKCLDLAGLAAIAVEIQKDHRETISRN